MKLTILPTDELSPESLTRITELPEILLQEEEEAYKQTHNNDLDAITQLHNDAGTNNIHHITGNHTLLTLRVKISADWIENIGLK